MTVKIKRVQSSITARTQAFAMGSSQPNKSLRLVKLGHGIPTLSVLRDELLEYTEVLLGRVEPPIDNGEMTMMEYANAVYSRSLEITMMLQRAEADGQVLKGSKHYKFRTGELRTFTEMALKCIELGSRRVTMARMEYDLTHG